MTRIAFATATEALSLDADMPPLLAASAAAGLDAEAVCWDDPTARWGDYAPVVLRSTWDYVPRLPNFLLWKSSVARHTRLFNPPQQVRWSCDKHYLSDLARAAVPITPTRYVEPGDDVRLALEDALAGRLEGGAVGAFDELVVKPAVGAGSKGALRVHRRDAERARLQVERLLAEGRSVLLQPYLGRVDEHGETAMIYIDGRFSHAIRKGPLLRPGDLAQGLFAAEDIRAREPTRDEGRVAKMAFNAIPGPVPLYARVDLLQGPDGQPVVLELELVEPSLFFDQAPGSVQRFVDALVERLAA